MPRKQYISGKAMLEMMGRLDPNEKVKASALRKRIRRAAEHYGLHPEKHERDQSIVFLLSEVEREQSKIKPVPQAA